MLADDNTYIYVAGLSQISDPLDAMFAKMMGSADEWAEKKAELTQLRRWVELLY